MSYNWNAHQHGIFSIRHTPRGQAHLHLYKGNSSMIFRHSNNHLSLLLFQVIPMCGIPFQPSVVFHFKLFPSVIFYFNWNVSCKCVISKHLNFCIEYKTLFDSPFFCDLKCYYHKKVIVGSWQWLDTLNCNHLSMAYSS